MAMTLKRNRIPPLGHYMKRQESGAFYMRGTGGVPWHPLVQ